MHCTTCQQPIPATARHCPRCGGVCRWRDWQVMRQIGQGGNGTVYLVAQGSQRAVLKVPAAHVTAHQHQVECRNLYLAASLDVAPAPLETAPDGLLMAYEPSPTQMPIAERARLLLVALNVLHNRALVHRDLKPENVVGHRLIDLGSMVDLVRDRDVEPVGTPGYAAPEAYGGSVAPSLDAYGAGWVLLHWMGGPDPDPAAFGPPATWTPGTGLLDATVLRLLDPEPTTRLSVGLAAHQLTGPWCRLTTGASLGSDLVTVAAWRSVLSDAPCLDVAGYATQLAAPDVQRYLAATGTRLPTSAELRLLARGTAQQAAWRDYARVLREGLVSDHGARHTRRLLWQPCSDGVLWGGTAYADMDTLADPGTPNGALGLRVART